MKTENKNTNQTHLKAPSFLPKWGIFTIGSGTTFHLHLMHNLYSCYMFLNIYYFLFLHTPQVYQKKEILINLKLDRKINKVWLKIIFTKNRTYVLLEWFNLNFSILTTCVNHLVKKNIPCIIWLLSNIK